jgi:hypothetical protein
MSLCDIVGGVGGGEVCVGGGLRIVGGGGGGGGRWSHRHRLHAVLRGVIIAVLGVVIAIGGYERETRRVAAHAEVEIFALRCVKLHVAY